jgi:site-specific recombinase XerC
VKGSSLFNELAVLTGWLKVRKPDAENYVFNSQKSTRLSRITVLKLFRAIARAAGLPERYSTHMCSSTLLRCSWCAPERMLSSSGNTWGIAPSIRRWPM